MTLPVSGGVPPSSEVVKVWYDGKGRERLTIQHTKEHTVEIDATPEGSGVSGGVPEPAECELEAIAALFTSALSQVGNWQDRARYLFDRGVRIQDGAALERPRPALPQEPSEKAIDEVARRHSPEIR